MLLSPNVGKDSFAHLTASRAFPLPSDAQTKHENTYFWINPAGLHRLEGSIVNYNTKEILRGMRIFKGNEARGLSTFWPLTDTAVVLNDAVTYL